MKPFFAKYGKEELLLAEELFKPVSGLGKWAAPNPEEPAEVATPITVQGGVPIIGASLSAEAKKLLDAGTAKTIEQAQLWPFARTRGCTATTKERPKCRPERPTSRESGSRF